MKNHAETGNSNLTRRRFLQRTAGGAAAACCLPAIVPSSVFGADAPNERINVAFIGLGNQSRIDLPAFLSHDDVQVVAVCDVNRGSNHYLKPEHFLGREPGQKTVNEFYAKKTGVGDYKGCAAYGDFREVLGRPDVDAVVLIVPDHWHALMTVAAAKAGKDIYCEKPLSLCIRQGQQMVKAVRQYKRVLQTGSMQRSSPHCRFACELARNGYLGDIKQIFTDVAKNNFAGPGPGWKPMPVPDGFDYETWLGPAPKAPYHEDRCLYRFRFIRDYSGGQTTNFGAHSNDLAQWALGKDGSGPIEFEDISSEFPVPGSLYNTPTKIHFRAVRQRRRTGVPDGAARVRHPHRRNRGLGGRNLQRPEAGRHTRFARVAAGREARPERYPPHQEHQAADGRRAGQLRGGSLAELFGLHQDARGSDCEGGDRA